MQLFLILVLLLICVVAGNSGDISVVLVEAEVLKDHDSTIVVDDDTSEADAPVRKQNLGYSDYYSLVETLSSTKLFFSAAATFARSRSESISPDKISAASS